MRRLRKLGVPSSEKSDESASQKRGALEATNNNNLVTSETSKDDNKNTIISGNCLIYSKKSFNYKDFKYYRYCQANIEHN